jgi:hypothetical protein
MGGEVLEDFLDVHDVEDSLDTFHVGAASTKIFGVLDSESGKAVSFLLLCLVSFMSDLVFSDNDPVVVVGSP